MRKSGQSGIGQIVVLLALILVAIVGFTAFYVYNTQKKDNKSPAVVPAIATQTPTQQNTQKYLVIKEWGIKIPVSDAYSDVTYKFLDANYISLQSATFASLSDNKCSAENTTAYLGGLIRFDSTGKSQTIFEGPGSQKSAAAVMVGGSYYDYQNPLQVYCQEINNEKTTAYIMAAADYIGQQLKHIQKTD